MTFFQKILTKMLQKNEYYQNTRRDNFCLFIKDIEICWASIEDLQADFKTKFDKHDKEIGNILTVLENLDTKKDE